MERQKFEDSFRDAFKEAEVAPTENVWTNIELDLERLESGKMKRRVLFYQLVAAASVVFAMAIGGVGYYVFTTDDVGNNGIAQTETTEPGSLATDEIVGEQEDNTVEKEGLSLSTPQQFEPEENITKNGSDRITDSSPISSSAGETASAKWNSDGVSASKTDQINRTNTSKDESGTHSVGEANQTIALFQPDEKAYTTDPETEDRVVTSASRERKLPALVRKRNYEIHFPKTEPDPIDLLIAQEMWKENKRKGSGDYEKVWTSVGFSAGTFNSSNAGSISTLSTANVGFQSYSASNTLSNEAEASGVAYAVGINVGTRLSKRWVLQGGLNYMAQNSNFTSNALITEDNQNYKVASSAEFSKLADANSNARVIPAAPYDVNNSLQFLSIPIQAGYLIVNRSFGIQVNGGISTDLFLQNTITPESGTLSKVSNGRGDDSPYRPLNFSGLMGTEFSYRFADRYRISLNPGIRYPFNSIYKSDVGLKSTPITYDVGLRFRYIFQ